VQISGGQSQPQFNGGTVTQPIYILLGGRATSRLDDTAINVHGIAKRAATNHLQETVRHLDVEQDVIIDSRIGQGSSDLTQLYGDSGEAPLANDTSFGVGHAPFSDTEQLVLNVAETLNADATKEQHPFIGEDVKVMANRQDNQIDVTVAAALVDRYVQDYEDYMDKKAQIQELVGETAAKYTDRAVNVAVNTADGDSDDEIYLTVTGTSAEMGDDGSVGRGNRVSGLITPRRAMSLEASSGKNPVAHIGKIYNLMAHRIADDIVDATSSADEAHVVLLSQIGQPINDPQVANVQIASKTDIDQDAERQIAEITEHWLENFDELMRQTIDGNVQTF
jgi:S-adenosylmethionine synthetase